MLIATLETANPKTGNMIQTWIIRSDVNPVVAINNGKDESVCGDCPLRGYIDGTNKGRGCYVAVQNAPNNIFKAYKNGNYSHYDASIHANLFKGRDLRLGSYGDPVAVPLKVWKPFIRLCDGRTGYTHQWSKKRFWRWKQYIMASTHTEQQVEDANKNGWRSFRTINDDDELMGNEIYCPASEEMKLKDGTYKRTCETCLACNGCRNGNIRRNIAIKVHGGNKAGMARRVLISLKMAA